MNFLEVCHLLLRCANPTGFSQLEKSLEWEEVNNFLEVWPIQRGRGQVQNVVVRTHSLNFLHANESFPSGKKIHTFPLQLCEAQLSINSWKIAIKRLT